MATPTTEPTAISTPEPIPTSEITPSPTVTKEPTFTPEPSPTVQPSPTSTKEATPTSEPQPPVEMVATGNVDIYLSPDGQKVGYFVPGQRFTPTGAEQNGWIQVVTNGNTLWIQEGGSYGPVGEVTPVPEVPPVACEVPHWPERTPDRKTGYNISYGEYVEKIKSPEWPYQQWWWRISPEDFFASTRMARITAVDRENQIITFYIGNGVTVQRKFTSTTRVLMHAHEIYRGMPYSQARQWGGNLCDLEEGDAVAILHPNEAESANPNPGLTDLWGVFTVQ